MHIMYMRVFERGCKLSLEGERNRDGDKQFYAGLEMAGYIMPDGRIRIELRRKPLAFLNELAIPAKEFALNGAVTIDHVERYLVFEPKPVQPS